MLQACCKITAMYPPVPETLPAELTGRHQIDGVDALPLCAARNRHQSRPSHFPIPGDMTAQETSDNVIASVPQQPDAVIEKGDCRSIHFGTQHQCEARQQCGDDGASESESVPRPQGAGLRGVSMAGTVAAQIWRDEPQQVELGLFRRQRRRTGSDAGSVWSVHQNGHAYQTHSRCRGQRVLGCYVVLEMDTCSYRCVTTHIAGPQRPAGSGMRHSGTAVYDMLSKHCPDDRHAQAPEIPSYLMQYSDFSPTDTLQASYKTFWHTTAAALPCSFVAIWGFYTASALQSLLPAWPMQQS